ncbi:MAG: FKBP-type peptidyl-prolyl cis-trans isomerase FklB [Pseudohongiellaceae bacterium]|jgi:FKBP-type peptidyl-prolyl cis-trans isomerase FklB
MKLKYFLVACVALSLSACGGESEEKVAEIVSPEVAAESSAAGLETVEQRLSYMVGDNMAQQFIRDGVELDVTALTTGINDALEGKESRLSEAQVQATIATLQERAQERQLEEQAKQAQLAAKAAENNAAAGIAYLAENAKKDGVVTTISGLQYKELTAGEGSMPEASDTVSVHYKGTLVDGTEFDSSYGRGAPAVFPVNGVIPGWTEALQLMNVGDKWELTIPSTLAYGTGGTGSTIGPNAVLVFEVELLELVAPEKPINLSQ